MLRQHCGIAINGAAEGILGAFADALIGAVNALLSGHVVFVRQVTCQVGRLEIDCIAQIERLDGLHQIVGHLC